VFRSREPVRQKIVSFAALVLLTGCGAATPSSSAPLSGGDTANVAGSTSISATSAVAAVASTGTTGSATGATTTARSAARSAAVTSRAGGSVAPTLTSTTVRSASAIVPALSAAQSLVAAASTGGNATPAVHFTGDLQATLTGDLSGAFSTTQPPAFCGKKDQNLSGTLLHTFVTNYSGKINSKGYGASFAIVNYHGPDTYKGALVVLEDADTHADLSGDGAMVVAAGETSGTIDSDIQSELFDKDAKKAHVSGTWHCS
jgi:hypothetical protein